MAHSLEIIGLHGKENTLTKVLSAKEIRKSVEIEIAETVRELKERGILPTISLFRVGENPDDISYEIGIEKKFKSYQIHVVKYTFDKEVDKEVFQAAVKEAAQRSDIHGILLFQPLDQRLEYGQVKNLIPPNKDVEGISDFNMAGLFGNSHINTYCAPKSIMKFFEFYRIDPAGKHVVILGRGQTVGKPLAMLLINAHATVSVCNSKTKHLKELTKSADIIISAMGQKHMINSEYVSQGQIVFDAGTIYENGKLYGDLDVDSVMGIVDMVTPTPDGISSLTTDMLALNLLEGMSIKTREIL